MAPYQPLDTNQKPIEYPLKFVSRESINQHKAEMRRGRQALYLVSLAGAITFLGLAASDPQIFKVVDTHTGSITRGIEYEVK